MASVAEGRRGDNRIVMHWIMKVAGRSVLGAVLLLGIQVALGASVVLNAMFLRDMVDSAVAGDQNGLVIAAVELSSLIVGQIALRAATRYLNERLRSTMENRFKRRLLDHLLCGDFATVKNVHTGEWMNRLTSDTVVVADSFTQIVPGFGGTVSKLVAAVIMLVLIQPLFGLFILVGGLVVVGVTWYFRRVLKRLHKAIQEADGRTRVFMQERLESLLVIKAFAKERDTLVQAGLLMGEHKDARMRRNRFSNVCNVLYAIVMQGSYVVAAVWCAWSIYNGTMSYGTFVAVLQLVSQVQTPFSSVSGYVPRFYAMIASAERLRDAELAVAGARSAAGMGAGSEEIATLGEEAPVCLEGFSAFGLEGAAFSYDAAVEGSVGIEDSASGDADEKRVDNGDEHTVIDNLTLRINRGSYVAFTGPSGCGKSTALKLFMTLYPLMAGERWYESDGERCDLQEYARWLFAYVPQGNMLMSGTVREIVAFGDERGAQDEDRLREALRIACADEFVDALDQGLDTPLGERGAGLSEGQMQRLSIARALFSERPVLLLDECTSALDEATEARMLRNLRDLTDKTVIIVTHRRAALEIVDAVVEFSEEGVHIEERP